LPDDALVEKLNALEKQLETLKNREQLERQECAICHKKGCNVISFILKKPVHSGCHEDAMKTDRNTS